MPSIPSNGKIREVKEKLVLNLIITGMPSIPKRRGDKLVDMMF